MASDRLWKATFHVTGSGDFPFDMLRYDGCYPARETDAAKLPWCILNVRTIRLVKVGVDRTWEPCRERWAAFRWRVSDDGADHGVLIELWQ